MRPDTHPLVLQYRTLFLLTETGWILRENDPDSSPGPRFWLGGCAAGNIWGLRQDTGEDTAAEVATLVAGEKPFVDPHVPPRYLDRYIDLLARDTAVSQPAWGVTYDLPFHPHRDGRVTLIDHASDAGRRFQDRANAEGMPQGLAELGFQAVSDLWAPWCLAVIGDEPLSIAFAARLSDTGAELGLATARAFRGQGYAAAATAGWSRLPALGNRHLFYSTARSNISSQRVAARLGLRCLGASLRLV